MHGLNQGRFRPDSGLPDHSDFYSIRATTVTVPLEAPLRHSNGAHWGRFVRTVVEVETDEGITELGEMGGGGESATLAFAGLKTYLVGHDPFDLNRMRYAICNPTASLYNNRTQLHAALEQALRFGQAISGLRNDYFEDPTWGLAGMRRLREKLSTPLATNTIVVDFEQLASKRPHLGHRVRTGGIDSLAKKSRHGSQRIAEVARPTSLHSTTPFAAENIR
jgi:L-alanine-DL-glutamate epimerase-like enolase superfamily enzyme